ncbi:hypothetical protein [Streptomyces sp. NRRL WC-3742]|uniref:hypothetical protein n=1 Tax=Streptomyces sp. NRRL WC-3742 TaxID=1463934 RepID=UPI000564E826|nr:hypothetical protein [Streptomyces sp. NRRL WC-3742]
MASMRLTSTKSHRPPRLEFLVAAIAAAYTAGYTAGVGNDTEQMVGAAGVAIIAWLWERWRS